MAESYTTKCPKMGAMQWSCKGDECICHLKKNPVFPYTYIDRHTNQVATAYLDKDGNLHYN